MEKVSADVNLTNTQGRGKKIGKLQVTGKKGLVMDEYRVAMLGNVMYFEDLRIG